MGQSISALRGQTDGTELDGKGPPRPARVGRAGGRAGPERATQYTDADTDADYDRHAPQ